MSAIHRENAISLIGGNGMLLIIFVLLACSLGFFIYSYFVKDYAKEVKGQVDDVYIQLMKELKTVKQRTEMLESKTKSVSGGPNE